MSLTGESLRQELKFPEASDARDLCESRSVVHMQTVSSAATPDREGGMEHLQAYHAAVAGRRRGNKAVQAAGISMLFKRLILPAAALFVASVTCPASYAQSEPFAGLAGVWSGAGTITLDDGSSERVRCRASYAVGDGGKGLNQTLTCASDSYKFNLASNVTAQGGTLSGTWSESTRNVNGSLEGRGGNGTFQVVANGPGFSANISLATHGNRQTVLIKSEGSFRLVSITLSRS